MMVDNLQNSNHTMRLWQSINHFTLPCFNCIIPPSIVHNGQRSRHWHCLIDQPLNYFHLFFFLFVFVSLFLFVFSIYSRIFWQRSTLPPFFIFISNYKMYGRHLLLHFSVLNDNVITVWRMIFSVSKKDTYI